MGKTLLAKWQKFYARLRLRSVIWLAFSITALAGVVLMGASFYSRFTGRLDTVSAEQSQALLEQVSHTLTASLRNMMKISDTLCYSVVKGKDIQEESFQESFRLLYDSNKNDIENIVLFGKDGEVLAQTPAATLKEGVEVTGEEWFQKALEKPENMHFSKPHVQRLFVHRNHSYSWVISLTQAVQITRGGQQEDGVLLLDIPYEAVAQMISTASLGKGSYIYLMDSQGGLV